MCRVKFRYADVAPIGLRGKRGLQTFIASIFSREKKRLLDLNYIFCSDTYLLEINKSFLGHDYYTDIISFDLSEENGIIGEVYISIDRVKDNSKVLRTSFKEEMLRVVFHGALHLIGYKDKKKSEITIMRHKEAHYLRLYGTS